MSTRNDPAGSTDLDPGHWPSARAQAHRMLDDILDYLEQVRERPVWRPIPDAVRTALREPSPGPPTDLAEVHEAFLRLVLPYGTGNVHPGFMGWVHGGGNLAGMLGEMLAAGLNANLGGRDHMPIEVERQILAWVRQWFGLPPEAGGLFVTGSSMANFMAECSSGFGEVTVGKFPSGTAWLGTTLSEIPRSFIIRGRTVIPVPWSGV